MPRVAKQQAKPVAKTKKPAPAEPATPAPVCQTENESSLDDGKRVNEKELKQFVDALNVLLGKIGISVSYRHQ